MKFVLTTIVFLLFSVTVFAQATLTLCPSGCTFNSFNDMAANLATYMTTGGIIVNVSPGTYNEQVSFGNVAGASTSNPIIIQSSTGDSSDVVLQAAASSSFSNPNYVIQINASAYYTFRNMSLVRSGTGTYARVVELVGGAQYITFEGCSFQGKTTGSSSNDALFVRSGTPAVSNITITGCSFKNGFSGLYLDGTSTIFHNNIVVENNSFSCFRYGVYLSYTKDVNLYHNTFTNASTYNAASCQALYAFSADDSLNIVGNYVKLTDAITNKGFELSACDGNSKYSLIANNEIIVGGSGTVQGITSGSGTTYKNYYHNSILSLGTNTSSSPAFYANGSQYINLRNNILAHTGGGRALQLLTPGNNYTTNYNLLWSIGTNYAAWSSTDAVVSGGIAAWGTASSGQGANSILGNPQFNSNTDLQAQATSIAGAGTPLASVTTDKDGAPRSGTAPYIGAYERQGQGPCAGFEIDSVVVVDVLCSGDSTGQITVYASGGSGPYTYSNGVSSSGPVLQTTESFASDQILHFSGAPTNFFWSPSTCGGGAYFDYSNSGGCTGGAAYYNGNGSSGFSGCFLRTPEADASGLNAVTLNFDITHSYNAGRPNDSIRFYIWINSGFQSQSIVPVTVNGSPGRGLRFDQPRTCENINVVFDLSSPSLSDKSEMFLYIETNCGYGSCNSFFAYADNILTLQGASGGGSQSSNVFNNLPGGAYTITVEDNNGCTASYSGNPAVVGTPAPLTVVMNGTNPSGIGGTNGKIWGTVSGGVPPYSYAWSGGATTSANGDTILNLASGTYLLTVTDDNGCTTSGSYTITGPSCALAVSNVAQTPISCQNGSNGTITISVTGANGAVEYSINNGSTWSPSNIFNGLSPGPYNIQVRDALGCTASASGNPYVLVNPSAISLSATATNVSTIGGNDGSINLTVSGGTPGYTYQWSNTAATTQNLTGLTANTYSVTVTDAAGCTATTSATVSQPGCILAVSNVVLSPVLCNGGSTGSITISATGGSGLVEYSINNGSTWSSNGNFTGLPAGSYNVQVRDAASCQASAAANPYTVQQPAMALSISAVATAVSTIGGNDGTVDATTVGGTSPYTYAWGPGGATTEDVANLTAGQYCVTVTDANACAASTCATVGSPGNPCTGFAISSVVVTQPVCAGDDGSIKVNITGGQNPVLYSADSGGTFQNGVSLFSVAPGTYNVLVRDNAGCELTYSINPVTITAGQQVSVTISQASDTLKASGSFTTYQWLLNGSPISGATGATYIPTQNGNYTVQVTDAQGCTAQAAALNVTVSGIWETGAASMKVWPNPATHALQYQLEGTQTQDLTLELWTITGQRVLSQPVEGAQGTLDVAHLAKGMYWLQLQGDSRMGLQKVVIQ